MRNSTRNRIGKNTVALLAGRISVLALGLWLNGQLARTVGIEGLGRYLLALTVEGIALAVVNMGLNVFATREFARSDAEVTRTLLGAVLVLKTAAAIFAIVLLNGLIAPLLFPGPRSLAIAWASFGLLPQAMNGGLEAVLKGRQRMEMSSVIDLTARLVAVVGGLIWLEHGGDERHVLACYVAGQLLATLALSGVVTAWGVAPRWRGWHSRVGAIVRNAIPFAGVDVVAMLYRRTDLLLLAAWHGDAAIGLYGAAYRLWEVLGLMPSSFLDALFPELARRDAEGDGRARLRRLYRRVLPALLAFVLAVATVSFIIAPQIITLLYGQIPGREVVVGLFRLLLPALPFTYLYLLNGHMLYATDNQRRVLAAMVTVTLGNALLNALLIPRWSYWSAAGIALASEIALLGLLGTTARRHILKPTPLETRII